MDKEKEQIKYSMLLVGEERINLYQNDPFFHAIIDRLVAGGIRDITEYDIVDFCFAVRKNAKKTEQELTKYIQRYGADYYNRGAM